MSVFVSLLYVALAGESHICVLADRWWRLAATAITTVNQRNNHQAPPSTERQARSASLLLGLGPATGLRHMHIWTYAHVLVRVAREHLTHARARVASRPTSHHVGDPASTHTATLPSQTIKPSKSSQPASCTCDAAAASAVCSKSLQQVSASVCTTHHTPHTPHVQCARLACARNK